MDTSFKRNFGPNDPIRVQDTLLNHLFAGTNSLLFTVEGLGEQSIVNPLVIRGIARFQSRLAGLPGVGKTLSVVDIVRRLHSTLGQSDEALPQRQELIAQYLFLYSLAGGDELATWISPDNRIAKILVLVHDDSTAYADNLIARARAIAAEELGDLHVEVASSVAANSALAATMVRGKLSNVALIAGITIAIASLLLRSVLGGLLIAVPVMVAIAFDLGAIGALQIRLDIASSAIVAMAVGIGADYAIYFMFRLREEIRRGQDYTASLLIALLTAGKAVIIVSSAIAVGYGVLCLSGFSLFEELGGLVAFSMVISGLTSVVLLPALLTLLRDSRLLAFLFGSDPAASTSVIKSRARFGG